MSLGIVAGIYDIDLSNDTSFCMIKAPQGDGNVRYINFILYNEGQLYPLPSDSDVHIQLEGINGAGMNVEFEAHIEDDMIKVPLIGGINDVAGAGVYRLVITQIQEGGYQENDIPITLATFNFYIFIVERKFNVNAAVASPEYNALLTAISNANGWKHGTADPPTEVQGAKVNDFYLNTNNGKVWVLKTEGWEYLMKLQGSGIQEISIEYTTSNSHSVIPTTGWSIDYPSSSVDTYIWTKQTFVMDDDPTHPKISYSVNYMGTAAEAWAIGTRDGVPVTSEDDTFENNSKYYSELSDERAEDAEAWAVGERGGTIVDPSDDTYDNNAKYYATSANAASVIAIEKAAEASASATAAAASETAAETAKDDAETAATTAITKADEAEDSAEDSEAWAVGKRNGTDVPSTDETYHNNSKYYANFISQAIEEHVPQFIINWETGTLDYTGGYFTFWVDENGYLKWGVESTI